MADSKQKLVSLDKLARRLADLKVEGEKIILCHGVFDLLHPGHIHHLKEASRQGTILVVTITPDRFVNKGPSRPAFTEILRAETLAALEFIDFIAISQWPSAVEIIDLLKPDIYAKGIEYADHNKDLTGEILREEKAIKNTGGSIFYTEGITYSSSKLINEHVNVFDDYTENWLRDFRSRFNEESVLPFLESLDSKSALIIGETIVDEYIFGKALGKSGKDPILAFQYQTTETYAGGVLAIANHLSDFISSAGVLTVLGAEKSRFEFVQQSLKKNVQIYQVTQKAVPTIHKKRFLDSHSGNKQFELYEMVDRPVDQDTEDEIIEMIEELAPKFDVTIIADYGHGLMTSKIIRAATDYSNFLAVNTQANAGNHGFNTLSRYPRADYVSIAGRELELETRLRDHSFEDLTKIVAENIDCGKFTVTLGKDGSLHFDKELGFTLAPALAVRVIDRVGAGDAVLALTSMLTHSGTPREVISFLTNVIGAEMVNHLGNRFTLDKVSMTKHIRSLLK